MLRPTFLLLWLFFTSLPWLSTQADIYKTVDEDGKAVFTDNPKGKPAESIKLKKGNTISLPPVTPSSSGQPGSNEGTPFSYREFTITKPSQDATIRGAGNFSVLATISPALRPSHSVQLYINGKPYGKQQKGLLFNLTDVDRGTHNIEIKVINSDGRVLKNANVTVHVRRTSVYRDTKPKKSESPSLLSQVRSLFF